MPTVERVLVVCTANQCRSPVAAALLRRQFQSLPVQVDVVSAGLLPGGAQAAPEVVEIANRIELNLGDHSSQQVTREILVGFDLILTMEREHVREIVLMEPGVWPYTFTLREFVRRAADVGTRRNGENLSEWLANVQKGRRHADLLGASRSDDVVDPMGGPATGYRQMFDELETLATEITRLGWGDLVEDRRR